VGRRILDALFTAIVLILAVPTTLILASWNSIPGDKLYPVKTGLENVTLFIFSGTPLVPKVSMKFTDRRLTEATKLLDKKGSTVGYSLLVAGAKQTQTYISEKGDIQSGTQFIQNIDGYKKQIEQTKIQVQNEIAGNPTSNSTQPTTAPRVTLAPSPTPEPVTITIPESTSAPESGQTVIVNVPETVVIQDETPEVVLQKLNDTEEELTKIQDEVKNHKGDHLDDGQEGSRGNSGQ